MEQLIWANGKDVLQDLTKEKNTLPFTKSLVGIKQYNNNQTPPDLSLWDQQSVALQSSLLFYPVGKRTELPWKNFKETDIKLLTTPPSPEENSVFLLHVLELPPPLLYNSNKAEQLWPAEDADPSQQHHTVLPSAPQCTLTHPSTLLKENSQKRVLLRAIPTGMIPLKV